MSKSSASVRRAARHLSLRALHLQHAALVDHLHSTSLTAVITAVPILVDSAVPRLGIGMLPLLAEDVQTQNRKLVQATTTPSPPLP